MTDIRGYVEQVTRQGVRGWAYDADARDRAPLIEILVDGRPVAVGTTDQPRPDLAYPDIGRDTFGFQISLPDGTAVELHRLTARIAGSGEPLPVLDDAGQYEGFVELFEGGSLKGWAWRCGFPEERVRVLVRYQGEVVGSSLANQLRPDLIGAGVGDGRHAFLIALPVVQRRIDPAQLYVEFEATGAQLTDLRNPDRAPPPPPIGAAPRAQPAVASASPKPAAPVKAPIAARPPMARSPMARSTRAPTPGAPAATVRTIPKRPIAPRAPIAPRPVASAPVVEAAPPIVAQPVQQAAPAQQAAPRPAPVPAPVAEQPAPQFPPATLPNPTPPPPVASPPVASPPVASPSVAPAAPPPTPAPRPAPQFAPEPAPVISRELYEALRGSLHLGDEDGLF